MKVRLLSVSVAMVLSAACGSELRAQIHETNRVSAELKEFLQREGVRDPETGAILRVRPKSPRFFDNPPLNCSIRKLPATNRVARFEIVLTVLDKTGTEAVHERIVLDAEPALSVEVERLTRHHQLAPERERRLREARAQKITEMTQGVLQYGMTGEQVIAAKGGSWKPGNPYQKFGAFEMRYEDMTLLFDPTLVAAYPAGEIVLGDPAPKPVPLIGFDQRHKR